MKVHIADATSTLDAADAESPLRPAELQVLRAQYEKEGDYVGVQTKFNFAWVSECLVLYTTAAVPYHTTPHHVTTRHNAVRIANSRPRA